MAKPPGGAPPFQPARAAYREFLQNLWYAQELFQLKGDAGLEGAKLACQAVARFIAVRHENPELAAPILALFKALEDVEKGIEPELFSLDLSKKRERSRSSLRKHVQLLAAVAMEVLKDIGVPLDQAADLVAEKVAKWPQFRGVEITATTIRNWREACRRKGDPRNPQFLKLKHHLLEQSDPRAAVDRFLIGGPPGLPES